MFEGVRTKTALEDWVFTAEYAVPLLRKQLGVLSLEGMGLGGMRLRRWRLERLFITCRKPCKVVWNILMQYDFMLTKKA